MQMTELFVQLVKQNCAEHELKLVGPKTAVQRGSQVSFHHEDAYPIVRALHAHGVICDYRAPGNMRFGFAPLYNSYSDLWVAVGILKDILDKEIWKQDRYHQRATVT